MHSDLLGIYILSAGRGRNASYAIDIPGLNLHGSLSRKGFSVQEALVDALYYGIYAVLSSFESGTEQYPRVVVRTVDGDLPRAVSGEGGETFGSERAVDKICRFKDLASFLLERYGTRVSIERTGLKDSYIERLLPRLHAQMERAGKRKK